MADGEFKIENRFSSSRGIFPYIVGILGVALVVVIFMLVTGIGRDRLPYTDYFFAVRVPEAADGSEALSLQSLSLHGNRQDSLDYRHGDESDRIPNLGPAGCDCGD